MLYNWSPDWTDGSWVATKKDGPQAGHGIVGNSPGVLTLICIQVFHVCHAIAAIVFKVGFVCQLCWR